MYLFIFDKCVLFKYGELEMKTQSILLGFNRYISKFLSNYGHDTSTCTLFFN